MSSSTAAYAPSVYLIIHGEIEIAPGRFAPGVESSSGHVSRKHAEEAWQDWCKRGLYDPTFHRIEIREEAPTLDEVLPDGGESQ